MKVLNSSIFVSLCVIVALATLAYGTVHQPTLALFYIVMTTVAMIWLIAGWVKGELTFSRHVFQIPLIAAAVYAFVQTIPFGHIAEIAGVAGIPRTLSLSPFDTTMSALHMLVLALFLGVMLAMIDRARRIEKVVNFILIFGFAYAFYAILQSFLSPTRIYGVLERLSPFGSFVNRHNFAAFIEMTIAVPLGMLMSGAVRRDRKLIYITAVVWMGIALLMSGSRGGLVAMLAGVGLIFVLTTRAHGKKKKLVLVGVTVATIAVIVVGAIMIGGETSLSRFAETAEAGDVTTDRLQIWTVTLKVIVAHLPFGAGIGAFGQAYTPFDTFNGLSRVEQAHNDYLQVLADAGLIGAVIAGGFLYSVFVAIKRNTRVENGFRRGVAVGAAAGIFAVLVHSLFDFVLHTTAVTLMFLVLLSLLAATGREFEDDYQDIDGKPQRHRRRQKASVMPLESHGNVRIGRPADQ
ncbi:MAG: O-antigen ligase family protein [Acidobacteria bacterium]|nr:O-antigen ligase family protein [Acidobacteriota bacterium]